MIRKAAAIAALMGAAYFLLFGGDYTFLDLWRIDREYDREVAELEGPAETLALEDSAIDEHRSIEESGRLLHPPLAHRLPDPGR